MKPLLFSLLTILFSTSSFAHQQSLATNTCESEGVSLIITVDNEKKVILASLFRDDQTEQFGHKDLDPHFLENAKGSISWKFTLDNDLMNTLRLSYDHYSDQLTYEYDGGGPVESMVFSARQCSGFKSEKTINHKKSG